MKLSEAINAGSTATPLCHARVKVKGTRLPPLPTQTSSSARSRRDVKVEVFSTGRPGTNGFQASYSDPDRGYAPHRVVSAQDVVLRFFQALNNRDIGSLAQLISEDCLHEDLAHESAPVNRKGVVSFYHALMSSMSDTMVFAVEDITGGDSQRVAVTWHLEIQGVEVPMTKGLSFYRINNQGRVCYVRQSPEHFIKVAGFALTAAGLASPLIGSLGSAATPSFWTQLAGTAAGALSEAFPVASGFMSGVGGSGHSHSSPMYGGGPAMRASPGAYTSPGMMQWAEQPMGSAPRTAAAAPRVAPAEPELREVVAELEMLKRRIAELDGSRGNGATVAAAAPAVAPAVASTSQNRLSSSLEVLPVASSTSVGVATPIVVAAEPVEDVLEQERTNSGEAAPTVASGVACLSGVWARDMALSDAESFERGMDLWQITGIQRATARLIVGLEIDHKDSKFQVHFVTNIPMFKVTEQFDTQRTTSNRRRDLRSGKTSATSQSIPGGVLVRSSWSAPLPGKLEEQYVCQADGTLRVLSTLTMGSETCETLQVYRRQAAGVSSDDLRRESDRKNGRANDILRKFGLPV